MTRIIRAARPGDRRRSVARGPDLAEDRLVPATSDETILVHTTA
jgi:hypothetical protein